MPTAVRRDPFEAQAQRSAFVLLRKLQARVMSVLVPAVGCAPVDWPLCGRAELGVRAGFSAISGSATRALNGVRPGSNSGDPHLGLLALGYVVEVVLDVEGVTEVAYMATEAGAEAYGAYILANGPLPPLRDARVSTNVNQGKGDTHRSKRRCAPLSP